MPSSPSRPNAQPPRTSLSSLSPSPPHARLTSTSPDPLSRPIGDNRGQRTASRRLPPPPQTPAAPIASACRLPPLLQRTVPPPMPPRHAPPWNLCGATLAPAMGSCTPPGTRPSPTGRPGQDSPFLYLLSLSSLPDPCRPTGQPAAAARRRPRLLVHK
jgi:hypothetical protein